MLIINRIKTLVFSLLGVSLLTIGLYSCSNENEINELNENRESLLMQKQQSVSVQNLGELHNLGLSYLRDNESLILVKR